MIPSVSCSIIWNICKHKLLYVIEFGIWAFLRKVNPEMRFECMEFISCSFFLTITRGGLIMHFLHPLTIMNTKSWYIYHKHSNGIIDGENMIWIHTLHAFAINMSDIFCKAVCCPTLSIENFQYYQVIRRQWLVTEN